MAGGNRKKRTAFGKKDTQKSTKETHTNSNRVEDALSKSWVGGHLSASALAFGPVFRPWGDRRYVSPVPSCFVLRKCVGWVGHWWVHGRRRGRNVVVFELAKRRKCKDKEEVEEQEEGGENQGLGKNKRSKDHTQRVGSSSTPFEKRREKA